MDCRLEEVGTQPTAVVATAGADGAAPTCSSFTNALLAPAIVHAMQAPSSTRTGAAEARSAPVALFYTTLDRANQRFAKLQTKRQTYSTPFEVGSPLCMLCCTRHGAVRASAGAGAGALPSTERPRGTAAPAQALTPPPSFTETGAELSTGFRSVQ